MVTSCWVPAGKPEEAAAVLRDGWGHTGGAGRMDTDGYLYVVDRIKGMIVTGDENVYSTEVEDAVAQHPAVANCTVVEVPDEQWANGSTQWWCASPPRR